MKSLPDNCKPVRLLRRLTKHVIGSRDDVSRKLNHLRRRLNRVSSNKVFAVDICAQGPRFFAHLTWVLEILDYCEANGLEPHIVVSTPYLIRRKGEDWFGYYFYHRHQVPKPRRLTTYRVQHISQIGFIWRGMPALTLIHAHQLFEKYVGIKREILDRCARFQNQHMAGRLVLGLHYRGSDKTSPDSEAPGISYSDFAALARDYLSKHPAIDTIFVATDESAFIAHLQRAFPAKSILFVQHEHYARGQTPAFDLANQTGDKDAYAKGEEALVDCLLLSKCTALIKTASILSGWSKIFNPQLPVIMATRPHAECLWFPERAIVKEQRSADC
ncbi:MAG: hypothetical protein BWX68_00037 [Verrucomicrobia bacterium ADurb.Bin063]|nr:MAG: hypothetical protein BWX68_00037 [Verrucomicrobia bacterium ADurb.Bin063]